MKFTPDRLAGGSAPDVPSQSVEIDARSSCDTKNRTNTKGRRSLKADSILRPYVPISWFHSQGIKRVLARLEPRLPDVGGKLFLTFTVDPNSFNSPEQAFETARDKLRRVFFKLRRGVTWEGKRYAIDAPNCVKVEFHENGWAHFHAVFLTRRFLPGSLLNHLWGYGRTNVQRIKAADFRYLLKYVTKGCDLPEWVAKRSRLRVFQSSRDFLNPDPNKQETTPEKEEKPKSARRSISTIGQRLERWRCTALLNRGDQYEQVLLHSPFWDILAEEILPIARSGRYLGGGHLIIGQTKELIPWINRN